MFIRSDWSDIKELALSPSQQMRKILEILSQMYFNLEKVELEKVESRSLRFWI